MAILFLLNLSIIGYSQEITEPAFVNKDEKNPKLSNLYKFITSNVGHAYDDNCFRGSGTVRFQVLKNGTIANLEATFPKFYKTTFNGKFMKLKKNGFSKIKTLKPPNGLFFYII